MDAIDMYYERMRVSLHTMRLSPTGTYSKCDFMSAWYLR